jgi:hypothetical protein
MGSLSKESPDEFLDSLKRAGIVISNEAELRLRLAEVSHWRYAFTTLAAHGRLLGIRFQDASEGRNGDAIRRAFAEYQFADQSEAIFAASLKAGY